MMFAALFIACAAIAIVGAQYLGFIDAPQAGTAADLARWVALLAVIAYALGQVYRTRVGDVLTSAAVWLGLGLVLVTGYSYRGELQTVVQRVGVDLLPAGTIVSEGGDVKVRRSANGHYGLTALVGDRPIEFMIDTGATHTTLNHETAALMGFDIADLDFTVPVNTANGMTFAAPASIDRLDVGPIRVEELRVLVARPGALSANLLGLNFLDQLSSYEVKDRTMTLRADALDR